MMKQNRIIQIIKRYPVLVGMALVFLVIALVLYIKLYEWWSVPDTVVTENMERSATIDGFAARSDIVRYLLSSVQEGDVDKAMRAFPIDEMALGVNAAKIIDKEEEFSASTYSPSSDYNQYFPVTSSEIAGQCAEDLEALETKLDWEETEILDVRILQPDYQKTDEYQQEATEISACWGADEISEMAAEIKCADELYILPITVIKYNDKWKIFQLGAAVSDQTESDLTEIDEETYNDLTGPEDEETQYAENPEQQLLPPNYFLAGQVYSESPEEAIRKFSVYIEKEDITSALSYGDLGHEWLNSNLTTTLSCQKEFAEQIAELYFGILLQRETKQFQTLEDMGMSGNEIIERLNPVNIPYMNLKEITALGENKYKAAYLYEGKLYTVDFNMQKNDNGWQIKSISAVSKQ